MFFLSGEASFGIGDLYMLIAIILCGFGYAEGGVLSKNRWMAGDLLGAYFSFTDYAACYSFYMPVSFQDVSPSAVAGLVYVSLFSMLIGFFLVQRACTRWYCCN